MSFHALYAQGFARLAACTLRTSLADPARNAEAVLEAARACHDADVAVAVFPELCLSGYAIDDLLLQDALLDAVERAVATVAAGSAGLLPLLLVGAPLRHAGRLYNCAVAIHRGRVLGVVPKSYLPNYREFYEHRHFASGADAPGGRIALGEREVPFGTDLLFAAEDLPGLVVHAEICEDLWVPAPPSAHAALAGATVLANLSASNITIGKAETRDLLCRAQSARCLAAYVYAAAGAGEIDHRPRLGRPGRDLRERRPARRDRAFPQGASTAIADVDLDLLRQERARQGTFDDNRRRRRRAPPTAAPRARFRSSTRPGRCRAAPPVERFPFVPADPAPAAAGLLRGLQHPGGGAGAAAARHRAQAGGDRRLGRAGLARRR